MFKHILIPFDGSELSLRAAKTGIELAKLSQGKICALHVAPPLHTTASLGAILAATEYTSNEEAEAGAKRYLADIQALADAAGVPFEGKIVYGEHPYEHIVQTVAEEQCDIVIMGSHGWRGMTRLLLGSETQKVLLGCGVPVLVCR
jgi:nucleotide-binding universal stress UspA family protein